MLPVVQGCMQKNCQGEQTSWDIFKKGGAVNAGGRCAPSWSYYVGMLNVVSIDNMLL